jgi:thiamine kinase-like enzyme
MHEQIEAVLQLVPALWDKPVRVTPLSGGITNRNYRLDTDGESYVLRIGGENSALLGIDRACEHTCTVAAATYGIGPEVLAFLPEHDALITRFVSGRILAPRDLQTVAALRLAVEAVRRFHDGPPVPGVFSPFTTVRDYYALAQGSPNGHPVSFPNTIDQAMELLGRIEESLETDEPPCPCHNDLLPDNFIDDGTSLWIIDWEYAGMGDRFFDLGNLAVNNQFDAEHELLLLELYFGEVRPDHLQRLRLMRLISDLREALWGFLQSGISTLDFDFQGYGQAHLKRFLEAAASDTQSIPHFLRARA